MSKVNTKLKEYKNVAKLVRENEVSLAQLNTSIKELEKFNVKLQTEIDQYKTDGVEDSDIEKLKVLSGVKKFPTRIKCATMSWHAIRSALEE